jgi:hypothetical protein
MQTPEELGSIHNFFGEISNGRRFTIIPKQLESSDYDGWHSVPKYGNPFSGKRPVSFEATSDVVINRRIDLPEQGLNPYVEGDEISSYYVHCRAITAEHPYVSLPDHLCAISAQYFVTTDSWKFTMWWDRDRAYLLNPRAISIVVCSDATSLPAICAAACGARSLRIEKETFFAVLSRRFGDALADELTRATYG